MVTQFRPSHLNRYRQIASLMVRHGLGHFLNVLGLERFVPFNLSRVSIRRDRRRTRPESIRMCIENLGTTFVKLGQLMSTRQDLLPPEYQEELAKLQDDVKHVPTDVIMELVVSELGKPLDEVFDEFEAEPLASGSIGQVHGATLLDGTKVAVKVRRPGVVKQVELDLEILRDLASNAAELWDFGRQYDLVGLVEEFSDSLREELDYKNEARNAKRMAENFADDPGIHIPKIYLEATSSGMLTMERIYGIKVTDSERLDTAGIDRTALSEKAARIILKMVFEDGLFHADPHPGNFFIEPDGRIGLIDFGLVVALDDNTRDELIDLVLAATGDDAHRLVDSIQDIGMVKSGMDIDALQRDLGRLRARYQGVSLGEVQFGPALNEVLALARRHRLQLPANLANLFKAMLMAEGVGKRLNPEFNLTTVLQPYGDKLIQLRYSPTRWARKFSQAGLEAAWLSTELPHRLRRILGDMERGGLGVRLEPVGVEHILQRLERIAYRVILGIIAAAVVIGLAVLLTVNDGPRFERLVVVLFVIGFVFAVLVGLWSMWSLLRRDRR